ncbi:MAG: tRNA (adenosine(37)-N6)-dimethylallyltransferase MiaA [Ruminococcus sp.]|nr:tRNA (adenosine(37)-N6)-dimethylallyltransferase MiaA [Ruminococcus sp.]
MSERIPLLAVVGPTASGKTRLAVSLAKLYNGEVVSADSMQIYKGLSIATAKPGEAETDGVPHHLIDFLEPDQSFSVADYVRLAKECITDIRSRGKLPIICGGTGLYVSSLIDNISFDETVGSTEVRDRLRGYAEQYGCHSLWKRLNAVDPESAAAIHENNLPRVIRALEVYELTGKPLSQHKIESRREASPYDACIIGIGFEDRQKLYDRINLRVDEMVAAGMVEEVRAFYDAYSPATAYQAIGCKELIPYFKGEITLEQAIETIKLETRRYAKRQLTWFRRVDGIEWVYADKIGDYKNFLKNVQNIIAKSKIMCYNID